VSRAGRNVVLVLLGVIGTLIVVYTFFPGATLALAVRAERSAAGLEHHDIDVGGDRVEYLDGGHGEPLVLLHGFGADKDNWTRVARYLTPRFRVIAPDLPGFGDSTRNPSARYASADQVDRVHAFVHALGLESFHLGGNSMGGGIAGNYAAKYPADVKSLWLVAPGGIATAEKSELVRKVEAGENPLLIRTTDDYERLLDFVFVEKPFVPQPIVRYLTERAIANREFNAKVFRDLRENPAPLEPALKGLPVRTLVLWGDHDRLVDVSGAKILGAILPNATVVVLPNVGHVPMIEKPEASARAFLEFAGVPG
jgi:pimeloyl-ACP methyl ester carboxylesterase